MQISSAVLAALTVASVSAHCLISTATGDLGGNATGLGVVDIMKQSSVTQFSRNKQETGFGRTDKGPLDPNTLIAAMQQKSGSTLPQVSANGALTMTIRQLNGDGAGPMNCSISSDASGKSFKTMSIKTQVPGKEGQSQANNKDFPLVAQMPEGISCTGTVGGQENVCMVKCQNPNVFGSVIPIQMGPGSVSEGSTAATTTPDENDKTESNKTDTKNTKDNAAKNDKKQDRAMISTRHHTAAQIAAKGDGAAEEKKGAAGKAKQNMSVITPTVRSFMAEFKAFLLTPRGIAMPVET